MVKRTAESIARGLGKLRSKPASRFPVGSEVNLRFWSGGLRAIVVEDRGNIGYGGSHVLAVRPADDSDIGTEMFEVVAESVDLIETAKPRTRA